MESHVSHFLAENMDRGLAVHRGVPFFLLLSCENIPAYGEPPGILLNTGAQKLTWVDPLFWSNRGGRTKQRSEEARQGQRHQYRPTLHGAAWGPRHRRSIRRNSGIVDAPVIEAPRIEPRCAVSVIKLQAARRPSVKTCRKLHDKKEAKDRINSSTLHVSPQAVHQWA
jgi:hypothetical protein